MADRPGRKGVESSSDPESPIVWIAAVEWDDLPGTDKRIVTELARSGRVVWVDPSRRRVWRGWYSRRSPAVEYVGEGIVRLRSPATPALTRWPVRIVTELLLRLTIVRNLPRGTAPRAIVIANPYATFPRAVPGTRVMYVTDDWIAGASLMGARKRALHRRVARNARKADAIAVITTPLVDQMRSLGAAVDVPIIVLPNGAPVLNLPSRQREAIAGVVGQLNERLDLDLLEGVVDAGVRLALIGPRVDRDHEFGRRLDRLIDREGVEWTGALEQAALHEHLATIGVGLTPYAQSDFNRASFPLKTLEYLAAGVPVVSSDLAASRWLDSEHVTVATSVDDFVRGVTSRLNTRSADADAIVADRIAFASSHSWQRRAEAFEGLLDATS